MANTVMGDYSENTLVVDVYARGADGRGIVSATTTYQAGDSGTTKPVGGTWSSSIPAVDPGKFLWSKTVYTYTDDTTYEVYIVTGMGATGATGATGPAGQDGEVKIYVVQTLPTTNIDPDAFYLIPVDSSLVTTNNQYNMCYYVTAEKDLEHTAHWEILKTSDITINSKENDTTYYLTGSDSNATHQKNLYKTGIAYHSGLTSSDSGIGTVDGEQITTGLYYSITD